MSNRLDECDAPMPPLPDVNIDPPPGFCFPNEDTQKNVPDIFGDPSKLMNNLGVENNCDPMQTGQIIEDLRKAPNRNIIYRYSKGVRACDEAVKDLFSNIVVIDDNGKAFPVPIIWATQERAVAHVIQANIRQGNSLVVNRIKLPMLAIYSSDFSFDQSRYLYHGAIDYLRRNREDLKPGLTMREKVHERDTVFGVARGIPMNIGYTLFAWTMFTEDMNQILEQIVLKFSPVAYIRIQGVYWETTVRLESIASNLEVEPGDQKNRTIKFQFNMTAETFIPQPIVRKKAVLKEKVNFVDNIDDNEIQSVIGRLEQVVEDLDD